MNVRLEGLVGVAAHGADAAEFLNRLLTQDNRELAVGASQATARLDDRGRLQALYSLFRVEDRTWILVAESGTGQAHADWLDRYLFSEDVVLRAIDGGGWFTDEAPDSAAQGLRCPRLRWGRDGFDVLESPVPADAVGYESLDAMRIRLGELAWPDDVPPGALLHDVGLGGVASLHKGCFLGQETVHRVVARGEVRKALVGLVLSESASSFASIERDGAVIGRVGRVGLDPSLGRIALGVVRKPFDQVGTQVEVGAARAEVVALPMSG